MWSELKPIIKGLIQVIAGSITFYIVFQYIYNNGLNAPQGGRAGIGYLISIGIPGAVVLAGILQVITGSHFSEMEAWWSNLADWQRAFLGLFTIILALCILFGGIVLADILNII